MAKELYERKLALLRQLKELTNQALAFTPEELVQDDHAHERVLQLLAEREGLMASIDQLDRELAQGIAKAAEAHKEALRAELLQIQEQNARLEEVFQKSLAQLREQTRKIQDGRQSQRAYFSRPSPEGAFIDTKR